MVAVLLVVTVATALPGAHALSFPGDRIPANSAQHPAGCHGRGPATPSPSSSHYPDSPASNSPVPASYECCVSGHQAAIPNATFTLRSSLRSISLPCVAALSRLDGDDIDRLDFVDRLHPAGLVIPSNSPPGGVPLRI